MAERQRQAPPPEPDDGMEVDVEQEQYTPPEAPQRPRRATRQYPTPPPPAAPQTERVRIEDAEYDVPPAVAAQVRSWEQAQARLDAIERQHQQTEQWRQGVERAVTGEQPPAQDEVEQLWFTNPGEARRRTKEEAKAEMRAEWQAQERHRTFWGTFEQEHPELAPQRTLVQYLLSENSPEPHLLTLPNSPEGRAQLAQAAREKVLGWMQGMRSSGQAPRGNNVPPVETGTRRRAPAQPRQERPEGPQSLKELQEMRSLQRRQARLRIVGNG